MTNVGRHARAACAAGLGVWLAFGMTAVAAERPTARPGPNTVLFSKPAGSVAVTPGARPGRVSLGNPYVTTGFIRKELPTAATGTPWSRPPRWRIRRA